jgi:hypothetical protein
VISVYLDASAIKLPVCGRVAAVKSVISGVSGGPGMIMGC